MGGGVVAVRGGGGGDFDELEGVGAVFLQEREHPLCAGEGAGGAADAVVVRDEGVDDVGGDEAVGGCDED